MSLKRSFTETTNNYLSLFIDIFSGTLVEYNKSLTCIPISMFVYSEFKLIFRIYSN